MALRTVLLVGWAGTIKWLLFSSWAMVRHQLNLLSVFAAALPLEMLNFESQGTSLV